MMDKVLLIDADSLIYYEAFKDQTEAAAFKGIDERFQIICRDNNCYNYIGFLTGGGEDKCFRYNVAKTKGYKSGRVPEKPPLFNPVKNYLKEKYNCEISRGLEADDCVAYWKFNLGMEATICSPDKDVFKQMPGTHYNFKWKDWKDRGRFIITTEDEGEKFLWQQVLMGDSTDSIPGIPKVGEKTALAILERDPTVRYEYAVLNKYREVFGIAEGLIRMVETFRLVYLLRTKQDVMREVNRELEVPIIRQVLKD
jgi:5'-3' exonuclease